MLLLISYCCPYNVGIDVNVIEDAIDVNVVEDLNVDDVFMKMVSIVLIKILGVDAALNVAVADFADADVADADDADDYIVTVLLLMVMPAVP